jgi:hypothetical protein
VVDGVTSREIALVADLALAPTIDAVTTDAAGDPDLDLAQAPAAALPAMEEDTTREATLPREISLLAGAAAEPLRLASAAAATLAATAGKTLALLPDPEALATRESPSLPELLLPKRLKDRPRSPPPKPELTQKNKPTEA